MEDLLRVLVVDDSAIYRSLIQGCLREMEDIECAGSAADGRKAIEVAHELQPDVILLDVHMPVLDGLRAIPELRRVAPHAGIIMVSSTTREGADVTLAALQAGALDFVTKPQVRAGEDGFAALRAPLDRVIATFRESRSEHAWGATASREAMRPSKTPTVDVIALGVSTGGPSALAELIPALPADLAVPVLIVQHMPARFTASLADSLNRKSGLTVSEAVAGHVPTPGEVLIAQGGVHLAVASRDSEPYLVCSDSEAVNSFRPSVDVLFESVARTYGARSLCVIMTGMGADGLRGVEAIRQIGGYCIAQNESSCAVYGMPRAVIEAGQADEVRSLRSLAGRVEEIAGTR